MANPWLGRRVLNYAHQGGAREGPSSTLHAMRQALASGADALELDVHATADRHLVVCHDPTVDRTTNGVGRIADLTVHAVQALDNAYWWAPGSIVNHEGDHPLRGRAPAQLDLRIPTLREVLEEFPAVLLNLDIKQTAPAVEPYEELLADLLREFGRGDDVIVGSFFDQAVAAFSTLAPEVSTAAPPGAIATFYQAVRDGQDPPASPHHAIQVPPRYQDIPVVTEPFLAAAHRAGLAVHVWTVDEPEEMERLVDLGVDGIMTDRPGVLAGVLWAKGVAYGAERPGSAR